MSRATSSGRLIRRGLAKRSHAMSRPASRPSASPAATLSRSDGLVGVVGTMASESTTPGVTTVADSWLYCVVRLLIWVMSSARRAWVKLLSL